MPKTGQISAVWGYFLPLNSDIAQRILPKNNFLEDLKTNQLDDVYNIQELCRNQFHF